MSKDIVGDDQTDVPCSHLYSVIDHKRDRSVINEKTVVDNVLYVTSEKDTVSSSA